MGDLTCGKNFTVMRRVKAHNHMFVMGKFLLNLTPVIIIIRFIIHGFLRNYTRRNIFSSWSSLFIYFLQSLEIWDRCAHYYFEKSGSLKNSFLHGLVLFIILGDAIFCYVNDNIKCINEHCDRCGDERIHTWGKY